MANLIGGIKPYPGANNHIVGTDDGDFIYGDPYTTGNWFGVPQIGGALSSGRGGNDHLDGGAGNDHLFGDAYAGATHEAIKILM
jgi:hypothetical protein